jgi:hypothetical protein
MWIQFYLFPNVYPLVPTLIPTDLVFECISKLSFLFIDLFVYHIPIPQCFKYRCPNISLLCFLSEFKIVIINGHSHLIHCVPYIPDRILVWYMYVLVHRHFLVLYQWRVLIRPGIRKQIQFLVLFLNKSLAFSSAIFSAGNKQRSLIKMVFRVVSESG